MYGRGEPVCVEVMIVKRTRRVSFMESREICVEKLKTGECHMAATLDKGDTTGPWGLKVLVDAVGTACVYLMRIDGATFS